jgi:hypothetical protein
MHGKYEYSIQILFLDIIQGAIFYLKHVFQAGFCFRLQVEPIQ